MTKFETQARQFSSHHQDGIALSLSCGNTMAPTKRMSADEKRQVILGIYHQTKAVYTEKEIIVLASKAGVTQNT